MDKIDRKRPFIDADKLADIRAATDWRALFTGLGIRKCDRRSKDHDWWGWSPFRDERTPSFHMTEGGRWYDFALGEGGGVIELIQRLEDVDCYEAGRIILENGWALLLDESEPSKPERTRKRTRGKAAAKLKSVGSNDSDTLPSGDAEGRTTSREQGTEPPLPENTDESSGSPNKPIRQNLVPLLTEQGTHPEFTRRGISEKTCRHLGIGLLSTGRSRLRDRIVFQVRGVEETEPGGVTPTILTHIGRATTPEQTEKDGKWLVYPGFRKTHEVYNIDELFLDSAAAEQIRRTSRVLIVEGPFDVAKCWEAGLHNVVATFGAGFSEHQLPRLDLIRRHYGDLTFLIWFDRDEAGRRAQAGASEMLRNHGFTTAGFDWNRTFLDVVGYAHPIPPAINDPCDMTVEQLQWLRGKAIM